MHERRVRITGTGSYLPRKVLHNLDLEKVLDTSDDWIRTRTGIVERRIAEKDQAAAVMARAGCRQKLQNTEQNQPDTN